MQWENCVGKWQTLTYDVHHCPQEDILFILCWCGVLEIGKHSSLPSFYERYWLCSCSWVPANLFSKKIQEKLMSVFVFRYQRHQIRLGTHPENLTLYYLTLCMGCVCAFISSIVTKISLLTTLFVLQILAPKYCCNLECICVHGSVLLSASCTFPSTWITRHDFC